MMAQPRTSHRISLRSQLLTALLAATLGLLACASAARAEVVPNAAGRYDTLALRDLGGKTAALVGFVADGGAFAPVELWKSAAGAFDVRKAKFFAGDVNADGIADGIVLYDLGSARSRLYVFVSNGEVAVRRTAWTSRTGAFAWSRAKLAVADLNRDGLDDVVALYDRGRSSAALYRFVSTGTRFTMSTGWATGPGTFSCSRAQLAAGDATGDGRDDAIVLYRSTTTSSRLYVFASSGTKLVKKTFWSGAYTGSRAKLAAGDVDSDGDGDVVCLYRKSDNTGRLDVFRSSRKAFARPAIWYSGSGGPLPASTCRFAVGDVTGDGRADAVIAQPTGDVTSSLTTCVSASSGFTPGVWWQGDWAYPTLRLALCPSPGMVVSKDAEVLDPASLSALRSVSAGGGTMTFAAETAQLGRVQAGDVLLAAPDATFPGGICRKVTGVSESGGRVVVQTAQATLTDLIDQGEVAFTQHITAADVNQSGVVQPGVRLVTNASPAALLAGAAGQPRLDGDVTDGFGFELTTTIAEKAEVQGSVWLDPDAYVDWELGWSGVESASFTQTLSTTTDLTVSLKASLDQEIKQTIYKQTLAVITIMVGPVPVVVTPEFEVYVGASGEVTAGVTAGVTLTTDASLGIAYDGDGWSQTTSFTYDLTPTAPQLFGSLELKGFAGAGLAFKIYAVAGPEAKIEPYVKLEAATNATPWWTLKAGVDTEIGFKVEALDITMLEVTYTFNLFEYVIDQAGSGSGAAGGSATFQIPSIRGKVLDSGTSGGLGGAAVEARTGAPPGAAAVATATAAADGSYILWGLAAGQYTVAASVGGYADNTRAATVTAGATTTGQDVLLAAVQNQGVTGRVVQNPGGAGIDGMFVGLYEGTATAWSWPDDSRYTWGGGNYEFVGLAPGQYWIGATDGGVSYFHKEVSFTVVAGQKTVAPDLQMVPHDAQGISGTVTSSLSGAPVAGATVEIHRGANAPAGTLERSAPTDAGGAYAFSGLEVGAYTIVVTKTGYVDAVRGVSVTTAHISSGQNVRLVPAEPGGVARTTSASDFLRYEATDGMIRSGYDAFMSDAGTVELWYRPSSFDPANILQVTMGYDNFPGGESGNCPILYLITGLDGVFRFLVNENDGGGPGQGTWHYVAGTTYFQLNQWYHLAAQWGPGGMRLFVNGHLEGSDPYEGKPEADWSNGTLSGGWFSLGENECHPSWIWHGTAQGSYKQLRVSEVERYSATFTPPDIVAADGNTLLLDHLIGGTYGEPFGFVWVP